MNTEARWPHLLDGIVEGLTSLGYRATIANRRERRDNMTVAYMRPDSADEGKCEYAIRRIGVVRIRHYSRPSTSEPTRPWVLRFKVDDAGDFTLSCRAAAALIPGRSKQLRGRPHQNNYGIAELNCLPDELDGFAKWLPHWIIARDAQFIRDIHAGTARIDMPPYARKDFLAGLMTHPAAEWAGQEVAPPYSLAECWDSMTVGAAPIPSHYYAWSTASHAAYEVVRS